MDKKIFCLSIIAAVIILMTNFSPSVLSTNINNQNKISVETLIYHESNIEKIITEINEDEVEDIKSCLINLNKAYEQENENDIFKYESNLYKKGILNKISKTSIKNHGLIKNPFLQHLLKSKSEDNISNSFCFVNVAGEGLMIFTIGSLLIVPTLILMSILGTEILQILIPIYVGILLLTHMIPFRILLPIGIITMDKGNISTVGLSGSQNMEVNYSSVQLQLAGFTGITINIPTEESGGFLFVSGFSILAKAKKS